MWIVNQERCGTYGGRLTTSLCYERWGDAFKACLSGLWRIRSASTQKMSNFGRIRSAASQIRSQASQSLELYFCLQLVRKGHEDLRRGNLEVVREEGET